MSGSNSPSAFFRTYAIAVGLFFALPIVFVALRTADLASEAGDAFSTSLAPLGRTLALSVLVAGSAAVLGTAIAWTINRSNVWGAPLWRVLLMLPLVLPSFVGAAAFLAALAPGGILEGVLAPFGIDNPRDFFVV